jgi:hypothetical protein
MIERVDDIRGETKGSGDASKNLEWAETAMSHAEGQDIGDFPYPKVPLGGQPSSQPDP